MKWLVAVALLWSGVAFAQTAPEHLRDIENFCYAVAGDAAWEQCYADQQTQLDAARPLSQQLIGVNRRDVVAYCVGEGRAVANERKTVRDIGRDFGSDFRQVYTCLERATADVRALPVDPYALHAYMMSRQSRDGPVVGDL